MRCFWSLKEEPLHCEKSLKQHFSSSSIQNTLQHFPWHRFNIWLIAPLFGRQFCFLCADGKQVRLKVQIAPSSKNIQINNCLKANWCFKWTKKKKKTERQRGCFKSHYVLGAITSYFWLHYVQARYELILYNPIAELIYLNDSRTSSINWCEFHMVLYIYSIIHAFLHPLYFFFSFWVVNYECNFLNSQITGDCNPFLVLPFKFCCCYKISYISSDGVMQGIQIKQLRTKQDIRTQIYRACSYQDRNKVFWEWWVY